ncbi:MAG: Txe/YoeB family addiction module toxin [Chitinispirillales bacterium]|nr:Txe/YoeB family addiction module toxin [Chitinispirillales bacterium]
MSNITFSPDAWEEYLYWQIQDRKTIKRINDLLKDIKRNGLSNGIGKPEPLKQCSAWSRRIDHANRLIYKLDDKKHILVIACRGHYMD